MPPSHAPAPGEEQVDLAADADPGGGGQAGQGGDDQREGPPQAGLAGGEGRVDAVRRNATPTVAAKRGGRGSSSSVGGREAGLDRVGVKAEEGAVTRAEGGAEQKHRADDRHDRAPPEQEPGQQQHRDRSPG